MTVGEWFTSISALIAFLLWFVVVARWLKRSGARLGGVDSVIWLSGGVTMMIHVACSFHVYHGWSHAEAVMETARQTRELTGVNWGGGVWLNYLFSAIWLGEGIWWVSSPGSYLKRPKWLTVPVNVFLAFMWFNATVIFGKTPIVQYAGIGAFVLLLALVLAAGRKQKNNA